MTTVPAARAQSSDGVLADGPGRVVAVATDVTITDGVALRHRYRRTAMPIVAMHRWMSGRYIPQPG